MLQLSRTRVGVSAPRRAQWAPAALALVAMLSGVVVVTMGVGLPLAARWIGLGVSVIVAGTGIGLVVLTHRQRRVVFAAAGWAIIALAAWTIVASAVPFDPDTARWVVVGSGIGYIVEATVALIAHELSPNRVVHVLEVRHGTSRG